MVRIGFSLLLSLLLTACPGSKTTTGGAGPDEPGGGGGTPVGDARDAGAEEAPAPEDPVAVFAAECRKGLDEARAHLDTILAVEGERTLENTVAEYDQLWLELDTSWSIGLTMRSVHPDPDIRTAAEECEQEVIAFANSLGRNRALYEAFAALDTTGWDPLSVRVVDHVMRDFRRAGVDKDAETRARLEELDAEITKVGQKFSRTLAEDVREVELDPADLAGMPEDWVASHPPNDDGKVVVTTEYPDYFPFVTYADSSEARKKLYVAFRSRGTPDNDEHLRELLQLRWAKARLLGYDDFADYYIEDKMMKTGDAAAAFIERVHKLAKKRARRDYRQLLARKRKDVRGAKRVEDWEKTYYEEKIKAESYEVDAKQVRQYFEYEAVEKGLLDITSEMYGIRYEAVEDPRSWHEDVKAFDVLEGDEKLGRIFLDMHPRDGKDGHAAKYPLTPGAAGRRLPEAVLVCNFPNPRTTEGSALMEHSQVETMFHEFGHLMHDIFSGHNRYYFLNSTERDFVEAPSQMFEEWAWNYETLRRFARHHETGEPIPKQLVAKMRRAAEFGLGTMTTYQLYYAAMVLELYRKDPAKLDFYAENRRLMEKYTPFRFLEGTARHASFDHLRNYPASYYTYQWSLVLAKDLLSPFLEHGLMNKEWTMRYREKILARGGEKDAADLVEDFLGRPFRFKAFEAYLTR